nr:unnamed protein product [Callosobruchus analis]
MYLIQIIFCCSPLTSSAPTAPISGVSPAADDGSTDTTSGRHRIDCDPAPSLERPGRGGSVEPPGPAYRLPHQPALSVSHSAPASHQASFERGESMERTNGVTNGGNGNNGRGAGAGAGGGGNNNR